MDNRIYGYARVSTTGQNEDRQLEALIKIGVPEQNIIIDKASGKDIPLLLKSWIGLAVTRQTLRKSLKSSKAVG